MGRELNRRVRPAVSCWRGLMLLTLAALYGCTASGGEPADRSAQDASDERAWQPYRAMVYRAEFGERFGLPATGVEGLDPGLQAIAVEITPYDDGLVGCRILLYVDSDLDIAYPDSGAGDRFDLYDGARDLFFIEELTDPDYAYLDGKVADYTNRVLFRSTELSWEEEQGFFEGAVIDRYNTELLPGIGMLVFGFICSNLDPALGPAEVWVLKSGSDDYVIQYDRFDAQHLQRFRLPERLQHAAWPPAVAALEHNDRVRPGLGSRRDTAGLSFEIPLPLRP